MANDVARSPIKLDTAGAVFPTGVPVRALSVRWIGATLAGHNAILMDAGGRIVWEAVADGTNYTAESRPANTWDGLTVDTLDSGVIEIEL